jgi:glucose-6-phosphate-specific signal transduction histidine kinase
MITFTKHTHEHSKIERVGFYLSLACAVHCIATPVLITLLPFLSSGFIGNHAWEIWFIGGSLVLAGVILFNDYLKHKNLVPMSLLLGSMAVKGIEMVWLGHQFEFITGSLGAVFIALAYFLNWKYKEKACGC